MELSDYLLFICVLINKQYRIRRINLKIKTIYKFFYIVLID